MRLLNVHTLKLHSFTPNEIPPYAILSHTWARAEDELTYQDLEGGLLDDTGKSELSLKSGARKVQSFCDLARRNGLDWVWVDTCNIDRTSSAELSEAIKSMYQWYRCAEICCVYLSDVFDEDISPAPGSQFRKSNWFTRGWTLQELIAPHVVIFYNASWIRLGERSEFAHLIDEITNVPANLFADSALANYSVAQRMSWASTRSTTREEDLAYCLLGIFGVHMPLLYGEGNKAFYRLQQEIVKCSNDQTIFVWGFGAEERASRDRDSLAKKLIKHNEKLATLERDESDRIKAETAGQPATSERSRDIYLKQRSSLRLKLSNLQQAKTRLTAQTSGVLAREPADFRDCHDIIPCQAWKLSKNDDFEITKSGIHIRIPVVQLFSTCSPSSVNAALLNCCTTKTFKHIFALPITVEALSDDKLRISRKNNCSPVLCDPARLSLARLRSAHMQAWTTDIQLKAITTTAVGNSTQICPSEDLCCKVIWRSKSSLVTTTRNGFYVKNKHSTALAQAIFRCNSKCSSEAFYLKVEVWEKPSWWAEVYKLICNTPETSTELAVTCLVAKSALSDNNDVDDYINFVAWKNSIEFEGDSITPIIEQGTQVGLRNAIVRIGTVDSLASPPPVAYHIANGVTVSYFWILQVTLTVVLASGAVICLSLAQNAVAVLTIITASLCAGRLIESSKAARNSSLITTRSVASSVGPAFALAALYILLRTYAQRHYDNERVSQVLLEYSETLALAMFYHVLNTYGIMNFGRAVLRGDPVHVEQAPIQDPLGHYTALIVTSLIGADLDRSYDKDMRL